MEQRPQHKTRHTESLRTESEEQSQTCTHWKRIFEQNADSKWH